MTAHQQKKLDLDGLRRCATASTCRSRTAISKRCASTGPRTDSKELQYLRDRRAALGGNLPGPAHGVAQHRRSAAHRRFRSLPLEADGKEMSTTMALVRIFNGLLKDKELGPRIVPIVADEARTFGMDNMFRQVGIYAPEGQLYEPQDAGSMLFYREAQDGQLLEEGINEAGALASWIAAATSYSVHDEPMLPFYIFYSMFGFQRVGDLIWAAADQRVARVSHRCDLGPHDARWRGPAASRRFESCRCRDRTELPSLRSGVRVRGCGDCRLRHAPDDDAR